MRWIIIALLLLAACQTTPTGCSGLTGSERDACIVDLAVETSDAEVCTTLDENKHTWCYTAVAEALDSVAPCERIADDRGVQFCKRDRIIAAGDAERCADLTHEGARNDCYYDIAETQGDWLTCVSMDAGDRKEQCLDSLARSVNDPQGCLRMSEENPRRSACIYLTSIGSADAESCGLLERQDWIDYCKLSISLNAEGTDDCNALEGDLKDFCLRNLQQDEI